jgi:4-amino-4-deoxy-L-arabinose transferase-like glycosyltransferase
MKNKSNHLPLILFIGVCLSYLSLMISHITLAYLDFGDGNYLYIARRMLQGIVIYKDILSPQPPLHLYTGTLILRIGDWLGNPLFTVRIFTLLLRIIHASLIYYLARQIFSDKKNSWLPLMAGAVYLFLPIGFWWSRGYQSEPLEILWLLLGMIFFVKYSPKPMAAAGIFSALGVLTNMTAAPYLVLTGLFLLIYERKKLFWWYAIPAFCAIALAVIIFQIYTDGMFLQNAILDQVGTYPKENTLGYMLGKIKWIGGIIIDLEGWLIAGAILGLGYYYKTNIHQKIKNSPVPVFIFLYALATLGSFIYATKGGTVDYIFTLGEPAVALFSVYGIYSLTQSFIKQKEVVTEIIAIAAILLLGFPGYKQDANTLKGYNYELGPENVVSTVSLIEDNSQPGEKVFCPPYFAFLANRPLAGEFSEQYVWFMKYANWLRYREGNPANIEHLEKIGEMFSNREVKIVLMNIDPSRGQQTGKIMPFRMPVDAFYHPIGQVEMRNETLTVFLPDKE